MPTVASFDNKTLALLRRVPYFEPLSEEAMDMVTQEIVARQYNAGEIVFLEGEPSAGIHLVIEGLCKIYHLSLIGREHILSELGPGDFCNEVSAVDGGPNPANLAALEDSTVWVVTKETLAHLRQQHPIFNEIIIKNLANHCRELVQRIFAISFLSVTARLSAFLLKHANESGELNRRRWTQEEIAANLGTVREMVARSLKELQNEGLIALNRHQIELLDPSALETLATGEVKPR